MADSNSKLGYVVGVDLGGTKILAGLFDSVLGLRGTAKITTKPQRGPGAVLERVARCVRDAVDEADLTMDQLRAVGLGVPGTVEPALGQVIFAPNLGWREVALKEPLEQLLGVPVWVENDCNVAVLGVQAAELKNKPHSVLGVFIGTGIGGGLILNGELYSGAARTAGEVGHMVLQMNGPKCGCGGHGCFEALASRTAMVQRIKTAVNGGEKTVLTEILPDLERLRSGDLRKAFLRGDKLTKTVVEDAAGYTGLALANLANLLNPEAIVLGGGIIEALGEQMLGIILQTMKEHTMPGAMTGVEVRVSTLGDHAAITGGAVLAMRLTQ